MHIAGGEPDSRPRLATPVLAYENVGSTLRACAELTLDRFSNLLCRLDARFHLVFIWHVISRELVNKLVGAAKQPYLITADPAYFYKAI